MTRSETQIISRREIATKSRFNPIQQLFIDHGKDYIAEYGVHMPGPHRKVIRAIQCCGTGAFGVHLYECEDCEKLHEINSSCGNRHCPVCQGGKSDEWLEKQMLRALPVNYFMITFLFIPYHNNILMTCPCPC